MATIYARIQPKSGQATFFRCGIKFGKAWKRVEGVDAATAKRLEEEQMLEVSAEQPEDFESDAPNAAEPAGDAPKATGAAATPAAAPAKPKKAK